MHSNFAIPRGTRTGCSGSYASTRLHIVFLRSPDFDRDWRSRPILHMCGCMGLKERIRGVTHAPRCGNGPPQFVRGERAFELFNCTSTTTAYAVENASAAAQPSVELIKDLLGRLDSNRLLQAFAVSELSDIEFDCFGDNWRERPQDFWECVETWPPEARQQAVDMLLSLVAKRVV